MPGLAPTVTPTNPPGFAPNGLGGFFQFVGGLAGQIVQGVATNKLTEAQARSTAKVQEILNANHDLNRATGPNDPTAAQNAANRSFLERFLPSSMLFDTETSTEGVVTRTPTGVYYAVGAIVLIGAIWLALRIFRR